MTGQVYPKAANLSYITEMNNLSEIEGFWWLPNNTYSKVAGRLIVEGGRAKLNLTIAEMENWPYSARSATRYDIIHGQTTKGKAVSLLKCFDLHASRHSSGFAHRVILANYVLVGGHVPDESEADQLFLELHLRWPSLIPWFSKTGISIDNDEKDFYAFRLKYAPPTPITFTLSDKSKLEIHFRTDSIPSDGGLLTDKVCFEEIIWIRVIPVSAHSFRYYLESLEVLKHFFSLCMLEYSEPDAIFLVGNFDSKVSKDGTEHYPHLRLYLTTTQSTHSDRELDPIEMLVPYQAIEETFGSIIDNWYTLADSVLPARSLYFSSLYSEQRYLESTFLSLAQAAEVFYRRKYGGTYISDDLFSSEVRPKLEAAISENIASDIKQIYLQRLKYFNEYSFSKRLKIMVRNHKEAFDEYVPDWGDKIRGIVKARVTTHPYQHKVGQKAPTE